MFCWTSHKRWKKTLLTSPWWCPSRPQQWQGLQGHRGGILERAPLLQGSPLLPVESKVQNLKKPNKDYFWKYNIFLDLATSFISGSKVDVPLELFAQSSHLAAARIDSGIWIQLRWILGIIVLEIVTTPTDIRYTNMKKEMLTTPSPIPLLPPVTIATGIFRSGKWASF